jgi:integral membrane protein
MPSDRAVRTLFRTVAVVEALTWAGLLVGMAFKYVVNGVETGVHVFGPLHGAAFIAYVVMTLVASHTFGWRTPVLLAGLVASIPPLATWPFEVWATRIGHLSSRPATGRPHPTEGLEAVGGDRVPEDRHNG